MKEYSFTIIATGREVSEELAEELYARSSDVSLSQSNGETHIGFDIEANNFEEAALDAVELVTSLGMEAKELRVDPLELVAAAS